MVRQNMAALRQRLATIIMILATVGIMLAMIVYDKMQKQATSPKKGEKYQSIEKI
jgi:hypothetical protein